MKETSRTITRRSFLGNGAAAAGAAFVAPSVITSSALGGADRAPASERVGMGFIGVGGMGNHDLGCFLPLADVQVVAVCDVRAADRESTRARVDQFYAAGARRGFKGCAAYNDFRELLARADIDAVSIATPDHWHAILAIESAKAGKDMYVEKPMDVSVAEGRAVAQAVKKYGRLFQHGTQQRSDRNFRFACELARNQKIGKLRAIKVGAPASVAGPVTSPMPVPEGLDYERWIGPAPWAPYTEARCAKGSWYHISDYTIGGFIGGWGIHHVDIAQWGGGTELTGPVEIEGTGTFPREGLYDAPTSYRFLCRYSNGVEMTFADDRQLPHGVRFEGDEGWVHVLRGGIDASPKSLLQATIGASEVHLCESQDHRKNLIDCIKTRAEPIAPVEIAHRSTTICSLAHIALLTRQKLRWDPARERFTNSEEANRLLTRPLRAPWHL